MERCMRQVIEMRSLVSANSTNMHILLTSCMHLRAQAQADVLVDTFHVIPEVRHLMRHIWLSLLPHLRCLDFDFNE